MENRNETLALVREWLLRRNLGEAIMAMENFMTAYPQQLNEDKLASVNDDFKLMTDYWRRGFKDAKMADLYDNLLRRMYQLYGDTAVGYDVGHSTYLTSLRQQALSTARDWSAQHIREMLEDFVSELTVLTLEPPHVALPKKQTLYKAHHQMMKTLFGYIVTSGMWSGGFAEAMEEILLLPTADSIDQQLLVTGVMLGTIACFDMAKFRMLINVYRKAADEAVRQRALVGWVFALDDELGRRLFPEQIRLVQELLDDEQCRMELVALQKQIIYCINAEKDHAIIDQEIMPDLMKQQGFRITRNGIEEQEEDPMRDILHPEESEQDVERLEASFQKMIDMQKQGSDIYFGGFSKMKGFPFFQELTNWFVPFYADHPEVGTAAAALDNSRFLQKMMKSGPFCNSDKYSFLFAFSQVMARIPQSMRELLDNGSGIDDVMYSIDPTEKNNAVYMRRTYLQDLYRFFKIFPRRKEFRNIFDDERKDYLFLAKKVFSKTQIEPYFNEVTAFLVKKGRLRDAERMLQNYGENRMDYQFYMLAGHLGRKGFRLPQVAGKQLDVRTCYEQALRLQPDSERALVGYARALFADGSYQQAIDTYEKLLELQPEKKNYVLNKAVCLTKLSQSAAARQLLYRLNYEDSDDENVKRVLAWTLTCDGKYEQAEKLYGELLSVEDVVADDLLNNGYCLWFNGAVDAAIDCFHRYLAITEQEAEFIIDNEKELILSKGITEAEMQLMVSVL